MRRDAWAVWLVLFALAGVAWSPAVGAQEEPDEPEEAEGEAEDEEEWEDEERDVRREVGDDDFRIESQRESPLGSDEWRAEFRLGDGRLDFEFESEREDAETGLRLRLADWMLTEYVDEDRDQRLGLGDTILARGTPSQAADRSLVEEEDGAIEARYGLAAGGSWALRFQAPTMPLTTDGVTIQPTELKFDVVVHDYPFERQDARLALQVRFEAEAEFEGGSEDGLRALVVNATTVKGFLRWVETADVDGAAVPVVVDASEQTFSSSGGEFERHALVVFNYPAGDRIVHDPSVGVSLAAAIVAPGPLLPVGSLASWAGLGVGALAAVVLVGATLAPRMRRRW